MTETDGSASPLMDELKAILAGLGRARKQLASGDVANVAEFWPRLDACAGRVRTLDQQAREAVSPLMLALLEELERTMAVFQKEHQDLGGRLRSTSRNLAADTAYRKAGKG